MYGIFEISATDTVEIVTSSEESRGPENEPAPPTRRRRIPANGSPRGGGEGRNSSAVHSRRGSKKAGPAASRRTGQFFYRCHRADWCRVRRTVSGGHVVERRGRWATQPRHDHRRHGGTDAPIDRPFAA